MIQACMHTSMLLKTGSVTTIIASSRFFVCIYSTLLILNYSFHRCGRKFLLFRLASVLRSISLDTIKWALNVVTVQKRTSQIFSERTTNFAQVVFKLYGKSLGSPSGQKWNSLSQIGPYSSCKSILAVMIERLPLQVRSKGDRLLFITLDMTSSGPW